MLSLTAAYRLRSKGPHSDHRGGDGGPDEDQHRHHRQDAAHLPCLRVSENVAHHHPHHEARLQERQVDVEPPPVRQRDPQHRGQDHGRMAVHHRDDEAEEQGVKHRVPGESGSGGAEGQPRRPADGQPGVARQ